MKALLSWAEETGKGLSWSCGLEQVSPQVKVVEKGGG